jgi:pyrroloquinoline-quinone synthase
MTSSDALQALDDLIQSRSILDHPFYVAWKRGALTRPQLAAYARMYYPHVLAFPQYLRAAIERADDPWIREELAGNLRDELNEPQPHADLWVAFAEALGVGREGLTADAPRPATTAMVDTFTRLAEKDTVSGLAALYAYESQQPEVSSEKIDGLKRHYGVNDPRALGYFDVHASIDTHHRHAEREALRRCLDGGASAQAMLDAAAETLAAYNGLLDGICQEAGVTAL